MKCKAFGPVTWAVKESSSVVSLPMRWMSELIGFKFALGNHLVHGKWSSWRLNSPSRSDFLGEQPFHNGSWKGREMVTPATSPSNWKVHSLRVDVQSSKFPPHWRGRCYFRAQIQLVKFWTGLINEAISVSYRIVVASVVIYGGRLTEKNWNEGLRWRILFSIWQPEATIFLVDCDCLKRR